MRLVEDKADCANCSAQIMLARQLTLPQTALVAARVRRQDAEWKCAPVAASDQLVVVPRDGCKVRSGTHSGRMEVTVFIFEFVVINEDGFLRSFPHLEDGFLRSSQNKKNQPQPSRHAWSVAATFQPVGEE